MRQPIAIVGLACVYPDANSPEQLWENVLAQRRAFRRLPDVRLNKQDYFDPDAEASDRTYSCRAAVIEGYHFDRARFRVFEQGYRAADLAHWLALDVAARALADAGFPNAEGLPRETTGIVLGNTLTGEFSRANNLRLRWPFVRRVIADAMRGEAGNELLARIEERFKAPFPETTEDSLPGGMSNTIAGRINSHFGFQGGGYTVDGACASSLLATAHACAALVGGDLDVALAGGVDLSLDPFELVGFAKAGALARDEMRVYDRAANGFWPGEGCGFLVLMREEDALALGRPIHALIRGWGSSSDGQPGITRPDVSGQRFALSRAYRRAGFGIDTVGYFEGHGTGTPVGDEVELTALMEEMRAAGASAGAAIGSIKANIGHTKAAAGAAGLIKAIRAVSSQIVPPHAACASPCALLAAPDALLRVASEPEEWPASRPLRAGVSAMGFGGVNVHIAISAATDERRRSISPRERKLGASMQDAELFVFSAPDPDELGRKIARVAEYADRLSLAELGDLAAALARSDIGGKARAAVVAATADELKQRLDTLAPLCAGRSGPVRSAARGIFFHPSAPPTARIGFVFPGQGAPLHLDGGIWKRRFAAARMLYDQSGEATHDLHSTATAQPAICRGALAGLQVLASLGVRAEIAVGHSVGELAALHWAGCFDGDALLRLAGARGRIMEEHSTPGGRMLAVFAPPERIALPPEIAVVCYNSAEETVVGGPAAAIAEFAKSARARGLRVTELAVRHAFHTELMRPACAPLAAVLADDTPGAPTRSVISTVTGGVLPADCDVRSLLVEQLCTPVRFSEALARATGSADVWIEVGPGDIFGKLAAACGAKEVHSIDAGGKSLRPLLNALAGIYAAGGEFQPAALFADRFTRTFDLDWRPSFFVNPCELAPAAMTAAMTAAKAAPKPRTEPAAPIGDMLAVVRALIARKTGVPESSIEPVHSMKAQFDLGSNGARMLAVQALEARGLDLRAAPGAEEFKFGLCTVGALAEFLQNAVSAGPASTAARRRDEGLRPWVETFEITLNEEPLPGLPLHLRAADGDWEVSASEPGGWIAELRDKIRALPGSGMIVCFPPNPSDADLHRLLSAAQSALARKITTFVHVHHGHGASGFIRSFKMEHRALRTAVIVVPEGDARGADWIASELTRLAAEHTEVHWSPDGRRMTPRIRLSALGKDASATESPGRDDVLLVSGGAKGFTLQWVLDLAAATGARFALCGRGAPDNDAQLAANLRLLTERGVAFRYYAADVLRADEVAGAARAAERELGAITGILHAAAATNDTNSVAELTPAQLSATVRTKVEGLRHLTAAVDPRRLRWLVALGSIIARIGLQGEAAYAVANEWLAHEVEDFGAKFPRCRCLTLELSAVDGEGRATRVARDFLEDLGVSFMPPAVVLPILRRAFSAERLPARLIVASRFGTPPTVRHHEAANPHGRFTAEPLLAYPGVEFIAEAELTLANDPYLRDHALDNEPLFPAVFGLEAMAQAVAALRPDAGLPVFADVEFRNRIAVPETAGFFPDEHCALRVMAQSLGDGEVLAGVRLADSPGADFSATCRFGEAPPAAVLPLPAGAPPVAAEDWYGNLFFHSGRLRRVRGYHLLRARHCLFELADDPAPHWFHTAFPQELRLGDPGARDAAIHGIQACIPHRRLLPVAVGRIAVADPTAPRRYVEAREISAGGGEFIYDVRIFDAQGRAVETWSGLKLCDVGALKLRAPWPLALLTVYLERCVGEGLPHARFQLDVTPRQQHGETHTTALTGYDSTGRPLGAGGRHVSRAHAPGLTAVAFDAPHEIACDLEPVRDATIEQWRAMLPPIFFTLAEDLAAQLDEPFAIAATRAWTAWETLSQKLGAQCETVTLARRIDDLWVLVRNGRYRVVVGRIPAQMLAAPTEGGVIFALAAPEEG